MPVCNAVDARFDDSPAVPCHDGRMQQRASEPEDNRDSDSNPAPEHESAYWLLQRGREKNHRTAKYGSHFTPTAIRTVTRRSSSMQRRSLMFARNG